MFWEWKHPLEPEEKQIQLQSGAGVGKGIFQVLNPLLGPGMGRKMKQQFLTSSSTSRLSKISFLLLEKGKWRDGLWIIRGLPLKSQIIPVGQEMKLEMIQCWEDEEIRS